MKVKVSRKAHFNAAHRLYRPDWDDQTNDDVFGKCNNPHFHGHNYELIVSVTGPIDPQTGFVMDMKDLKDLIRSEVEDAFDLQIPDEDFGRLTTIGDVVTYLTERMQFSEHLNPRGARIPSQKGSTNSSLQPKTPNRVKRPRS